MSIEERNAENYAIMCYKATDLQDSWEPALGDKVCTIQALDHKSPIIKLICTVPRPTGSGNSEPSVVWLPTLNQLFDIYKKSRDTSFSVFIAQELYGFVDEHISENHGFGLIYPTMDELVLAFIMERLFHKKLVAERDFHTRKILSAKWVDIMD